MQAKLLMTQKIESLGQLIKFRNRMKQVLLGTEESSHYET